MNKPWLYFALVWCPVCLWAERNLCPAPEPGVERHRSPVDVAVLPGGRALTANQTADSVSLLDLAKGEVLAEQPCGRKPAGVACSRDGRRAAVSNLWSGTLTLLEVQATALRPVGTVAVGAEPRGAVFAPDGASVYVALSGANEVVQPDGEA